MTVQALDHVNIVTADLDGTARFYAELLGLQRRDAPPPLAPDEFQWLHDPDGRPVVHVRRRKDAETGSTGAIDHVAFACSGYDECVARLVARGIAYRTSALPAIALRQVFLRDPNGVTLELNFRGEG